MVTHPGTFRVHPSCKGKRLDSREEATMLTTMDVEVLELCTMVVTSTPITSPAMGLDMIELLLKNFPAIFPGKNKNPRPHDRGLGGHRVPESLANIGPTWAVGRGAQPGPHTYGILLPSGFSPSCPDARRPALPTLDLLPHVALSCTLPSLASPSASPALTFSDQESGLNSAPGLMPVNLLSQVPSPGCIPVHKVHTPGVGLLIYPPCPKPRALATACN